MKIVNVIKDGGTAERLGSALAGQVQRTRSCHTYSKTGMYVNDSSDHNIGVFTWQLNDSTLAADGTTILPSSVCL